MSEQLEIEYKTLLTSTHYQTLLQKFQSVAEPSYTQTNYYFDTPSGELQKLGCGLRIRVFEDAGEQTLKSPQPIGLLETTDPLTLDEIDLLISNQQLKAPSFVATKLETLGIDLSQLSLFAELTTKRTEIQLPEGLLALDESWYGPCHDFELELEVPLEKAGKEAFLTLLNNWSIDYQPSQNKIARAKKAFLKNND